MKPTFQTLLAGEFVLAAALFSPTTGRAGDSNPSLLLWYRQPATEWLEALPVGNARLGAMVFGGVAQEQIQLNEDTIWSGGRAYPAPAGAYQSLPEIRQLLFDGKYAEAEALVRSKLLIGRGEGEKRGQGADAPLHV